MEKGKQKSVEASERFSSSARPIDLFFFLLLSAFFFVPGLGWSSLSNSEQRTAVRPWVCYCNFRYRPNRSILCWLAGIDAVTACKPLSVQRGPGSDSDVLSLTNLLQVPSPAKWLVLAMPMALDSRAWYVLIPSCSRVVQWACFPLKLSLHGPWSPDPALETLSVCRSVIHASMWVFLSLFRVDFRLWLVHTQQWHLLLDLLTISCESCNSRTFSVIPIPKYSSGNSTEHVSTTPRLFFCCNIISYAFDTPIHNAVSLIGPWEALLSQILSSV